MSEHKIKWHKYPEEKPEESGTYFLTIFNPATSELRVDKYPYDSSDKGVLPEYDCYDRPVIITAWAKYPEPYKGDGSSSDGIWAPYPEEVPDGTTICLVTCESAKHSRFVDEDLYLNEKEDVGFQFSDLIVGNKVVAWIYYPKPYKEEK
ncbi:MAG: hypothetical protein ACI4SI_08980 [Candidatus Ornithospirochaeta sp.]